MKTEERAVPHLVEATREETSPREIPVVSDEDPTGEIVISEDWGAADAEPGVRPAPGSRREDPAPRGRRPTLTSPIPAMMAEGMRNQRDGVPVARDPNAPEQGHVGELTRRLGDASDKLDASGAYTVEVVDDGNSERRQRAARLIDRARACADAGDLAEAARAAEEALEESDNAAPPGIVEVIEPARPLLARIFTAYVGPLSEVPVLARRSEEIAALRLDPRKRAVLARIDGQSTLDQIFDGARIPASDALRVAAALLRDGLIRVV
jgi:hypothetical protein